MTSNETAKKMAAHSGAVAGTMLALAFGHYFEIARRCALVEGGGDFDVPLPSDARDELEDAGKKAVAELSDIGSDIVQRVLDSCNGQPGYILVVVCTLIDVTRKLGVIAIDRAIAETFSGVRPAVTADAPGKTSAELVEDLLRAVFEGDSDDS